MNVLIMGAGGVGGYFGALLGRAGHPLTVVARGAHLEALQTNGLRIETAIEDDFTVPVHALSTPEPGRVFDLIMMSVKSYDVDEAIHLIRHGVGPDTTILTLLNGVESGEQIAAAYGSERVLDGVVYIESFIKEPGVVAQVGGPRRAVFGNRNGANGDREKKLLDDFLAARWNVELADNVIGALWNKFAYLGPYAAFNTVTNLNSGQLCQAPESEAMMREMVAEYVAVGNAEGADLGPSMVEEILGRFRNPMIGMTSMLRDRVNGKRIEHDALVGSVVQRGKANGIATPVSQTLYSLLAPVAAAATHVSV